LKGIWIGVQSGSPRVRNDVFKRRYSNEQIINQARIFHKYGVSVRYDFIFDNPFETFEESLESIFMMMQLPQPFSLNLFSLKYFPNTEITEMARRSGFITEGDIDDNRDDDRDTYVIHRDRETWITDSSIILHSTSPTFRQPRRCPKNEGKYSVDSRLQEFERHWTC
jgi:radical SAM superfamily enzyme YgiQ (UPF0313 family)